MTRHVGRRGLAGICNSHHSCSLFPRAPLGSLQFLEGLVEISWLAALRGIWALPPILGSLSRMHTLLTLEF